MIATDFRKKIRPNTMTTDEQGGIVLTRENDVERAGYRSAADQIFELTRAGKRLQEARQEQYAKPSGMIPRHYGEIDQTVAKEKTDAIGETVATRAKERADKAAEEQAAKEAAKAEKPAPEGGGVT